MTCDYEIIKKELDYKHYGSNDYCIEYHVYFMSPEWSTGQWFNVEGLTSDGSLVDLLLFGYTYDSRYNWLIQDTYKKG